MGEYEEVAEEEARRISTSLGCSSSGQNGGQGEGWHQSLETPTTQPPAPTGPNTIALVFKRC